MSVSDVVAGNLTVFYLTVMAVIKIYGILSGRDFAGMFVLVVATVIVVSILIASLAWDISHKPTYVVSQSQEDDEDKEPVICRGGICWHGVAVKSPASKLRFRLPPHRPI